MTRAFTDREVSTELLESLVDAASRAPSAGNTQAVEFLVLQGRTATRQYWDQTLSPEKRAEFAWPTLLKAPVLVVVFVDADAYVTRYSEPDKRHTELGTSQAAWSTPYWWVDGGMATMTILLGAEDAGLGAAFFGLFDHETHVKAHFGVPERFHAVGTVALGWPAEHQRPGRSAGRGRRGLDSVIHRDRWHGMVEG